MFFTVFSQASKLGGIQATYVGRSTCPPSCVLQQNGCYGESIRLRPHWDRAEEVGRNLDGLVRLIRSFMPGERYRYGIVGDLPGAGEGIDHKALQAITKAVRTTRVVGWAYTHKDPLFADNAEAIAAANRGGFIVNLSANGPSHADELSALGVGPVVTLLPKDQERAPRKTPQGRPIVFCPASMKGSKVTCRTCGKGRGPLCARSDRNYIIGFFAHGPAKRKAEAAYASVSGLVTLKTTSSKAA